MIYNLEPSDSEMEKWNSFIESSMVELKTFFELGDAQTPNLIILPDRKTINILRGKETEDWLVGWSIAEINCIYALEQSKFGIESKRVYTDNMYKKLLKHEIAHVLFFQIADNKKPVWLNEGVAVYLSAQHLKKERPTNFSTFLNFYDCGGSKVYEESGFVVEELIKQFGKEKLLELIKSLKNTKTEKEFFKSFKKIYGFDLSYKTLKISNK